MQDPSLRIESSTIINLRGVSTKLYFKYDVTWSSFHRRFGVRDITYHLKQNRIAQSADRHYDIHVFIDFKKLVLHMVGIICYHSFQFRDILDVVYDAEGESAMATSQDQREGELQVSGCLSFLAYMEMVTVVFCDCFDCINVNDILRTFLLWGPTAPFARISEILEIRVIQVFQLETVVPEWVVVGIMHTLYGGWECELFNILGLKCGLTKQSDDMMATVAVKVSWNDY